VAATALKSASSSASARSAGRAEVVTADSERVSDTRVTDAPRGRLRVAITPEQLRFIRETPEDATTIEVAATVIDYEAPRESEQFALEPGADIVIELHDRDRDESPGSPASDREAVIERLTPREREVLELVAEGLSNRAIAERLGNSEHTVKFHVSSLLGKLGAVTRAELVAIAIRRGLIMI
jgi:DNA-binding CsgD family transcriptional regulator